MVCVIYVIYTYRYLLPYTLYHDTYTLYHTYIYHYLYVYVCILYCIYITYSIYIPIVYYIISYTNYPILLFIATIIINVYP